MSFTESRIPRTSAAELAVAFCFLVTFPGFFVYHSAVGSRLAPVLGGFTVIAAAAILPILVPVLFKRPQRRLLRIDVLFVLFLAVLILSLVAHHLAPGTPDVTLRYFSVIVVWTAYYLLARTLPIGRPTFYLTLIVSFVLICLAVMIHSEGAVFRLGVGNEEATYQSFALLLFFCASLLVFVTRRTTVRWTLIVAATGTLGLVGARTELILFVLAIVMLGLTGRGRWLTLLVTSVVAIGILASVDRLREIEDNRIVDLLYSGAEGSIAQRSIFLERALETIKDAPFFGEFRSYPPGAYAHNLLSVWVDFGLAGLLALLLLFGYAAYRVAILVRRTGSDRDGDLRRGTAVLVFCCLLALVVTKAFFYSLVPLTLGLVANLDLQSPNFHASPGSGRR